MQLELPLYSNQTGVELITHLQPAGKKGVPSRNKQVNGINWFLIKVNRVVIDFKIACHFYHMC